MNFHAPKILLAGMVSLMCAFSATLQAGEAGNVIRVKGFVGTIPISATTTDAGSAAFKPLNAGDPIHVGETVITGSKGGAQLQMKDGAIIALAPGTRLDIVSYDYGDGTENVDLVVVGGRFRTITGEVNKDFYKVSTPAAEVKALGTVYDIRMTENPLNEEIAMEIYQRDQAVASID